MPPSIPLLLRPAIIELRFTEQGPFDKAVSAYKTMLATDGKVGTTANVYNFKVGKDVNSQDILLRLTWGPEDASTANRTIIYWEVAGDWNKGLYTSRDKLVALGLREIEKPDSTHPHSLQIGELGTPIAKKPNDRSLASDDAANLMGITINPPVPTVARNPGNGNGFIGQIRSAGWLLLAAVLLGVAIGTIVRKMMSAK